MRTGRLDSVFERPGPLDTLRSFLHERAILFQQMLVHAKMPAKYRMDVHAENLSSAHSGTHFDTYLG